jgi:hypothetical protein
MEQLIQRLTSTVGLDAATAARVASFIKDHVIDIPQWLGSAKGLVDKLPGSVGNMLGGGD